MVVKQRRGRRRYVAFLVEPGVWDRASLARRLGREAWRLTVFDGVGGIVRVPLGDVAEAIEALEVLGARPVTTSGTILQAKRRLARSCRLR